MGPGDAGLPGPFEPIEPDLVEALELIRRGDTAEGVRRARALLPDVDRQRAIEAVRAFASEALGRASVAAGRATEAACHFQRATTATGLGPAMAGAVAERLDAAEQDLAAMRRLAAARARAGLAATPMDGGTWLDALAHACVRAPDLHEAVEQAMQEALPGIDHKVRFLICLAGLLKSQGDPAMPVHYLNAGREMIRDASPAVRLRLARELVAVGHSGLALDLLVDELLVSLDDDAPGSSFSESLRRIYRAGREAELSKREHGHELLLSHMQTEVARMRKQRPKRALCLVEVGTTRENVPTQGSTRRLADFCKAHRLDFVTVDMDPQNSRMAQRAFDAMGVGFRAITMKGEDYLRTRKQAVDFAFLDAYDFDHGGHTELRQSRYTKFLGSRIDEEACHRMHLECAMALTSLLSPDGIVCIDDTWLQDGRWTAKGALAVPFLLEQGFEIIAARNRAALLRRKPAAIATAGQGAT